MNAITASFSWERLGIERPSVAMLDPSTTTWVGHNASSQPRLRYPVSSRIRPAGGATDDVAYASRAACHDPPTGPATVARPTTATVRAVLWDFGGVILSSPFEAFNSLRAPARPARSTSSVASTRPIPITNAWARLERNDITPAQFDEAFADESEALGHRVPGADVLALLSGEVRPEMVVALDRVIAAGYARPASPTTSSATHSLGAIGPRRSGRSWPGSITSSRSARSAAASPSRASTRSPASCSGSTPHECVFLDDLGINLKPAAAMGMRTIKVARSRRRARGAVEHPRPRPRADRHLNSP